MSFSMNVLPDQILSTCASLIVNHIWQSAALTSCIAIVLRVLPAMTARHRCALWQGALFFATVAPFLAFGSGESHQAVHSPQLAGEVPSSPLWNLPPIAGRVILLIWATTCIICLARLCCALGQLRRLLRNSTPSKGAERAVGILQNLNARGHHVSLSYNETLKSPVSIRLFGRTIIISRSLVDELSDDEIAQIFRHEVAHLERFDTWITLATKLVIALFPLSIALYYIEHQLSKLREVACDDVVLQSTASAHQYASCLARVAEATRNQYQGLATMFVGGPSQLAIRIEHILSGHKPQEQKSLLLLSSGIMIALLASTTLHNSREIISFRAQTRSVALSSRKLSRAEAVASATESNVPAIAHRHTNVQRASFRRSTRPRSAKTQMYLAITKPLTPAVVPNPPVDSLVVFLPENRRESEETLILVVSTAPAKKQLERQLFSFLQI